MSVSPLGLKASLVRVCEYTEHCSKRESEKKVMRAELWAVRTSLSDLTDCPRGVKASAVKIQSTLLPRAGKKRRDCLEMRLR